MSFHAEGTYKVEIVEAFASETPAACERLMRRHILGWREWLPPASANA